MQKKSQKQIHNLPIRTKLEVYVFPALFFQNKYHHNLSKKTKTCESQQAD